MQGDDDTIDVHIFPKLRTYLTLNGFFYTEPYLTNIYNRGHRFALVQFRCGVMPLSIKRGRFQTIPVELYSYTFWPSHVIEDELPLLLNCSFFSEIIQSNCSCMSRVLIAKWNRTYVFLMDPEVVKCTARFVFEAMLEENFCSITTLNWNMLYCYPSCWHCLYNILQLFLCCILWLFMWYYSIVIYKPVKAVWKVRQCNSNWHAPWFVSVCVPCHMSLK